MSSSVVGIDLGYQNGVIAAAGRGGVDVILNGSSNRLNPTMVGFDDCRRMGEHATSGVSSNLKNTVTGCVKRLVGLAYDDPRAQQEMKEWPGLTFVPIPRNNNIANSKNNSIGVQVQFAGASTVISMEAVYGMMVKHLGEIAALKAQQQAAAESASSISIEKLMPQDYVIAIPNYYTDAQRQAVLTACRTVGISGVQRLMHENTATALAYGIFKDLKKEFTHENPSHVMFIDMGASAYTVSLATFEPGKLIVKASYCDAQLGGRDFDDVVARKIAAEFSAKYKGKLSSKADPMSLPKTRLKLLSAAEKAKKTLSPAGVKEARINLEMLLDDYDFSYSLSASDYEALCGPLLQRLEAPIVAALKEVGLTAAQLAAVEIVGGSTRIGCVKQELTRILGGIVPSTTLNADECVARGAALQSAILSPRFKVLPYEIVEAQPYPIKISWEDTDKAAGMEVDAITGGESPTDSVVMFDRGLTFPIVRRVTLKRSGEFVVKSQYDDAALQYGLPAGVPRDIAEFTIKAPVGDEKKVRVNVKNDIHGILLLSSAQMVEEVEEEAGAGADGGGDAAAAPAAEAEEKKKKIRKTNLDCSTCRPLEWSEDEISKAYEAEVSMHNTDRVHRETADMRNELESYIYDMRDKVASDSQLGQFGTNDEKDAFVAKNEEMEHWVYEDGFGASKSVYAEKLAELKALGSPIEKRAYEAQGRATAVSALQSALEMYKKWVNDSQADEKYAHITDDERETVRKITDDMSGWMYEMLDKQGGLAPNQDAALTVADLAAKTQEVNSKCGPIMRKPVPKKKPEEPKKDAPASTDGEAVDKKSDDGSAPMELEGAAQEDSMEME